MLNGLLDFSKIEAGKLELEDIDFSPRDLVDDTLRSFSEMQRNLRLESRVDEDVPLQLRGDPLRLRQVLVNVAGNALSSRAKAESTCRYRGLTRPPGRSLCSS